MRSRGFANRVLLSKKEFKYISLCLPHEIKRHANSLSLQHEGFNF